MFVSENVESDYLTNKNGKWTLVVSAIDFWGGMGCKSIKYLFK